MCLICEEPVIITYICKPQEMCCSAHVHGLVASMAGAHTESRDDGVGRSDWLAAEVYVRFTELCGLVRSM